MTGTPEALQGLLVALLVGLLIGLDRERAEHRKQRMLFAGIRTFPLISLLGGGMCLLRPAVGSWPLVAGFLAVAAIAVVSYQRTSASGDVGATTEVAALVTYVLGALAGAGQFVVAGAVGVAVAVLLATKIPLERLSHTISEQELWSVLELAVISAIVLPLLPDKGYGPWQVWNPFRIWMVVVLVSTVSFAGFVAVRWRGERAGLFWASGLGALVSSTATTVAMAQRSREAAPEQLPRIAAAAILASVVMCGRLVALVAAIKAALLPRLAVPMGVMAAIGLAAVLVLARGAAKHGKPAKERAVANPFSLRSALVFGALFAGILLLVRASDAALGAKGTFLAALLSGLVDVDAVSIAISRGARPDTMDQAVTGIVAACASNQAFKAGAAVVSGAGRFRRDVAVVLLVMAAAGIAAAVLF